MGRRDGAIATDATMWTRRRSALTVYALRLVMQPDEQELILLELIDAEYTRYPFYGSRKIVQYLKNIGHTINRKRVQSDFPVYWSNLELCHHNIRRSLRSQ